MKPYPLVDDLLRPVLRVAMPRADAVMRLSRLASELEDEVCEVDLNPALVLPAGKGVIAVDALVALR